MALPQWLKETINSLHCLLFKRRNNLEMLPEWLSTLTNLKTIGIADCPKLLSLPANFHHLSSLESLKIVGCPELCRKYQPHVGECWPKIAHIKVVEIEEPEE